MDEIIYVNYMATDREEFARIREVLKKNPKGMNVIEIAAAIDMHRQSVTKYLEMLTVSGQVEVKTFGPSKVYYLSQRLPLSAMLSISSDMIILLDRDLKIINANEAFLARMNATREDILNKVIGTVNFPVEFQPSIMPFITDAILGQEARMEANYRKKGKEQFFNVKFLPVVFDDGQPGATVILEDITSQKKAEREREMIISRLREGEQRFMALIQNLKSGVMLVEASGKFSIYNPAYLKMFGLSEMEMENRSIRDREWNDLEVIDKDGNPLPLEHRPSIKAFTTGIPVKNMLAGFRRRLDGKLIWAVADVEVIKAPDGSVDKLICTYHDITERKLAEETLEKYRLFSENTRDIILFVDRDGRILEANEAAIKAYGYSREELLSMRIYDLRATELEGRVDRQMDTAFEKGILFETLHRRKDGILIPVEVSSQGRMIGGHKILLSVARDITERKRAEEELRKLSLSVEQSPATIVITDTMGNIEYVNPKFTRLTGYTPEEAVGLNPGILKSGRTPPSVYKELWDTILSGKTWHGEFLNRKKNGELYYESAMISPVKNEQGKITHFMAIKEDITERKRAEEELRKSEQRLNRSQEIAHLGSWELSLDTNSLTWSDEAYRIFGLQPQEFGATYEAFLEAVHPEDRAAVDNAYSSSIREGRDSYEIVHRVVRRSTGEVRIVHEKCEHYRDSTGCIVRSVGMVHDITERRLMEKALEDREEHLKMRLNSLLAPEGDIGDKTLREVLDLPALQESMDSLYDATGIGIWILDLEGNILAGKGWQDICSKFHRCHPQASKNCLESDLYLAGKQLREGEFTVYKCKNGMWDISTPIIVNGKQVANIYSGQFFYDDEPLDRACFEKQAERYGFDKKEYLAALDRVPRVSRDKVLKTMGFYTKFARMIAQQSYTNARLAKALMEKKQA